MLPVWSNNDQTAAESTGQNTGQTEVGTAGQTLVPTVKYWSNGCRVNRSNTGQTAIGIANQTLVKRRSRLLVKHWSKDGMVARDFKGASKPPLFKRATFYFTHPFLSLLKIKCRRRARQMHRRTHGHITSYNIVIL